jgi:hypothetical protein
VVSMEESYKLFINTLARLDRRNLALGDEFLAHEIFEELNIDSTSFLHEWTVNRLIEGNLVPASLKDDILNLRESILHAIESKNTVYLYRNDSEWARIRESANNLYDKIKAFKDV